MSEPAPRPWSVRKFFAWKETELIAKSGSLRP